MKLHMLHRNFTQVLIKPLLRKGSVIKSIKPMYHLICLLMGSLKIFCFISVAPIVCVSRVFVYDAVDVNKIVAVSSIKPPLYAYLLLVTYLQVITGIK